MKAPYPSQAMSFWLSALVWTAWILIVLVTGDGLSTLYLVIAAITGFIASLYEAGQGRLLIRRIIRARAQWRLKLWHPSRPLHLLVGNIICTTIFLFAAFSLLEWMLRKGSLPVEFLVHEWQKGIVLATAIAIGDFMSGNGSLYQRVQELIKRLWYKTRLGNPIPPPQ